MPADTEATDTVEMLLPRLQECREVAVFEAIERLVQAARAVGLDAHGLVDLLDQGKTFEQVLKTIEAKLASLQKAA